MGLDLFPRTKLKSSDEARITNLEDLLIKVAYYEEISSGSLSGQISIPAQTTIILDQWANGVDAIYSPMEGGKPTYEDVLTDVISFDTNGNYVLNAAPIATPFALIYYLVVKLKDFGNLNTDRIIEYSELKVSLDLPHEYLDFTTNTANPIFSSGRLFYDNTKNALSYYNESSDVTVNLGQEVLFPVVNTSGADMPNGSVISPAPSGIILADRHFKDRSRLIAVVTSAIADGQSGYATRLGQVGGLDTSMYSAGQILYLGNDGQFATAPPMDGSYTVTVGVVDVVDAVDGIITVDPNVADLTVEVTDTNGFPTDMREGTVLSVDAVALEFTISPTGSEFHFYERGNKYEKLTAETVVWTDVEGEHWFYYSNGTLTHMHDPNSSEKIDIILNKAFVGAVYWNAADKEVVVDIQDERHSIGMSPQSHLYLHLTQGAKWVSGFSLGDFDADGDGDAATSAQFSVSEGLYFDEDISHVSDPISVGDTIPVLYNLGANADIRQGTTPGFSVLSNPAGRLYYNEFTGGAWQLSEVPNRDACCYHIFSFNGQSTNVVAVMGQVEYTSVANARAGAATEISSIVSNLPFPEMIPIATLVYETRDTYDNAVSARIRSIAGENYINWTNTELSAGATPSSHTNLTDVEKAALGVNQGHIDDQLQTIAGEKVFSGKLTAAQGVVVGNNVVIADATNVGLLRYRLDGNSSYLEQVMQTGAAAYAWVVIQQNTW